jgi:hypothetical protein
VRDAGDLFHPVFLPDVPLVEDVDLDHVREARLKRRVFNAIDRVGNWRSFVSKARAEQGPVIRLPLERDKTQRLRLQMKTRLRQETGF